MNRGSAGLIGLSMPLLLAGCGTSGVGALSGFNINGTWGFATTCDGVQNVTDCLTFANSQLSTWLNACTDQLNVTFPGSARYTAASGSIHIECGTGTAGVDEATMIMDGTVVDANTITGNVQGSVDIGDGSIHHLFCTFTLTRR